MNESERLRSGVDRALAYIVERRGASAQPALTVVSPLAEGADQLVAERALGFEGTRLVAALPLEPDRYVTDFSSPAAVERFSALIARAATIEQLPPAPTRAAAYAAAGEYVLDHCDVLLAVWDGAAARGVGGTGGIVARARERELALAWVYARDRRPRADRAARTQRAEGEVTFERF